MPLDGAKKPTGLTTREVVVKGSIIGAIVTVPSLVIFFVVWMLLDDLMVGAIAGVIAHFVAMGFSLKISKKLLIKKDGSERGVGSQEDGR